MEKSIAQLNRSLKFEKRTKIVDDILNFQRLPVIKIDLGYDKIRNIRKENLNSMATNPPKKVNEQECKSMLMFSKTLLKKNATGRRRMMSCRNLAMFTRTTRMNS